MLSETKQLLAFVSIVTAAILIFLFSMLDFSGLMAGISIIFVSFPFYLILSKFELEEGEKLLFAVLLGITIFPSIAYLLGLLMPFRLAMAATFAVLIIVFFAIKKLKDKN